MNTRTSKLRVARVRARGFTLIELGIVVIIIALLAGIALVALRNVILTTRSAGEKQVCVALRQAVEQFKQQFGFLPPVIDDFNGPYETVEAGQPMIQRGGTASVKTPDQFLEMPAPDQNWSSELNGVISATDQRFSTSSLPIYIVGAGDAIVDGKDGPGFTFPTDSDGTDKTQGHFRRAGKVYEAMFDVSKDRARLTKIPAKNGPDGTFAFNIVDRWGRPFRYYRWLPVYYTKADAPDKSLVGQVKYYNVPVDVEIALGLKKSWPGGMPPMITDTSLPTYYPPELRSAEFAIISLGADGVLGANPKDNSVDDIVELGK